MLDNDFGWAKEVEEAPSKLGKEDTTRTTY
jgi:hypothetical protein